MRKLLAFAFIGGAVLAPALVGARSNSAFAGATASGDVDGNASSSPSTADSIKATLFGAFGALDFDPRVLFGLSGAAPDAAREAAVSTLKALAVPVAIGVAGFLVLRKVMP